MQLGLHIANFTFGGSTAELAPTLGRVARSAEEQGFAKVTVMDHLWQIGPVGPRDTDMLEAYTTLGYLAAQTTTVELFTLVTGVTYRSPGLLAKAVTTLDVLSGGRAWLGLGAAWNEEEAIGLGLGYAPTKERFEMLEECLQICLQMWSGEAKPYEGKHYQLGETLNVPAPLSKPRPRIMIGGSGEKKTLRLVAQYADACNLFGGPDVAHKLEVLRGHCTDVGRDYDEIVKTATAVLDAGPNGENTDALLASLRSLHELGITVVHGGMPDLADPKRLEHFGREIVPVISAW